MYQTSYETVDLNTVNEIQTSEHLLQASKIITDFFKTPANLLEFLSQTIWRIDNYRINEEVYSRDVNSYLENLLIDRIVQPWLKNEADVQVKIAEGLKAINEYYGSDYIKEVQLIEKALDHWVDDILPSYTDCKNAIFSIQILYAIGDLLKAYKESQKSA